MSASEFGAVLRRCGPDALALYAALQSGALRPSSNSRDACHEVGVSTGWASTAAMKLWRPGHLRTITTDIPHVETVARPIHPTPKADRPSSKVRCRIDGGEAVRAKLARRDGSDRCRYCRVNYGGTIDHVHPLSAGGSNRRGNLVLACASCNSAKGTKTLAEFTALATFHWWLGDDDGKWAARALGSRDVKLWATA